MSANVGNSPKRTASSRDVTAAASGVTNAGPAVSGSTIPGNATSSRRVSSTPIPVHVTETLF